MHERGRLDTVIDRDVPHFDENRHFNNIAGDGENSRNLFDRY